MASSHQPNIPLGKFEYHVFLTHNWGPKPWENHQRVSVVNTGLAKRGLKTWFDEVQMEGDISRIMTKGVEKSCVVVVFITEQYIRKVDSDDDDNCKFEFYHARAHRKPTNMIPVLMERVDRPWNGPVGAVLGYHLYVDMTEGPTEQNITELFNMIVQKIGREVGPCPSPSLESSSSSATTPVTTTTSSTPNPASAVVDELTTILSNAKLGDSERQAVEQILRKAGFDDAETILDMTEDHATRMGIQPGHFIKILKAAKQAPQQEVAAPQEPVRQRALKHGSVYLDFNNTWIRWRNDTDTPSWNPVQNPDQTADVTRVDMNESGITPEDFQLFCEILTYCPNIDDIDLRNNNFGDEGAAALAEALPALPKLTVLWLYGNQITAQGAKGLCRALPSLPLLQQLSLGGNNLGDEGAAAVAEALPALPNLTQLYLGENQITAQGAESLCRALPSLPLLKELWLSVNDLGDEGVALMVGGLRSMRSLTEVDLENNGASDEVIETAQNTLSFVENLYL